MALFTKAANYQMFLSWSSMITHQQACHYISQVGLCRVIVHKSSLALQLATSTILPSQLFRGWLEYDHDRLLRGRQDSRLETSRRSPMV